MNTPSRYLIVFFVSNLFVLTSLIYFDCFSTVLPAFYYHREKNTKKFNDLEKNETLEAKDKNLCKFPAFSPSSLDIENTVKHPKEVKCRKVQPQLTFLDEDGGLFFNKTELMQVEKDNITCEYSYFDRGSTDGEIVFDAPIEMNFDSNQNISLIKPFVQISCRVKTNGKLMYRNIHAHPTINQDFIGRNINRYLKSDEKIDNLNLLIIVLESTSMEMFHRHLPLTLQYLQEKMGAERFEKFAKVGENTLPNLVPLFTGLRARDEEKWHKKMPREIGKTSDGFYDNHPMIWNDYKLKGHVTSYLEDQSRIGTFQYSGRGFKQKPVDFWYFPFWRTMEIIEMPAKSDKFCFGNAPIHKIFLDIVRRSVKIFSKYHLPYFFFGIFSELSHDFTDDIERMDYDLLDFLVNLNENENASLNNTLLILMGDHGPRFNEIRPTFQGFVEERHPALFMKFPALFYSKYQSLAKNIKANAKSLITAFDLHETLVDILIGNYSHMNHQLKNRDVPKSDRVDQRGLSLLKPLPLDRTCAAAGVPIYFCLCDHLIKVNSSSEFKLTKILASHVLRAINTLTAKNRRKCSKFKFEKILYFVEYKPVNLRIFTLGLQTSPNAKFEAFLALDPSSFQIVENMTRIEPIDSYGKRGKCIKSIHEAKLCHCIH